LNPKNGDAYFLYGRALLEYAIQRNSVLGQSAKASAEEVETQQVEAVAPSGKKEETGSLVSETRLLNHRTFLRRKYQPALPV
jgi:hypothetical protein